MSSLWYTLKHSTQWRNVLEWSSGWDFFLFFSFYVFSCILVLLISWKLVFWFSRWSNSNCQSDLKDGHSWSLSVPMPVMWWWSASPLEGSCWDDLGSVYSMVGLRWFHISLDTREGVASFLGFVQSQDSTLAYSPVDIVIYKLVRPKNATQV